MTAYILICQCIVSQFCTFRVLSLVMSLPKRKFGRAQSGTRQWRYTCSSCTCTCTCVCIVHKYMKCCNIQCTYNVYTHIHTHTHTRHLEQVWGASGTLFSSIWGTIYQLSGENDFVMWVFGKFLVLVLSVCYGDNIMCDDVLHIVPAYTCTCT